MAIATAQDVPQPALEALTSLCQDEGINKTAAHELISFLLTKQLIADLPSARRMDTSPSKTVDQLWHALLLNTSERNTVEQALPGLTQVPHSTRTRHDREEVKLQRMAVSLTAMHNLLGVKPRPTLWREAGYKLRSIKVQLAANLSAAGSAPDITVYVYDGVTHDQHVRDMLSRLIGGLHDIEVLDKDGTPINNYMLAPLPYPIIHAVRARLSLHTHPTTTSSDSDPCALSAMQPDGPPRKKVKTLTNQEEGLTSKPPAAQLPSSSEASASPRPLPAQRSGTVRQGSGAKEVGAKGSGVKGSGSKEAGFKSSGVKGSRAKETGAKMTGAKETGAKEAAVTEAAVKEAGVKVGGTKQGEAEGLFTIHLRSSSGKLIDVRCSRSSRPWMLFPLIEKHMGLTSDNAAMLFDGERLTRQATCEDYGIEEGSILDVLERLRSC